MLNYSRQILEDNQFRFWVSLFTFLISCLFLAVESTSNLFWAVILFLTYSLFLGLGQSLARRGKGNTLIQFFLIAVDVTAITAAIYLTGQFQSPLYILYVVVFGVCLYHGSLSHLVYSAVLSVLLYVGMTMALPPEARVNVPALAGQLMLMGVLTGVLTAILKKLAKEKKERVSLNTRARVLSQISDVLSGSLLHSKDCVKTVSSLIEEAMRPEGFECRIALHKPEQRFFPPSGGRLGVHIPIMAGEYIFGTMIITREKNIPLDASEQNFFSSISRSLGLYLHRSKIWEDFHSQLEKVEAGLLLNASTLSSFPESWQKPEMIHQTLTSMKELVGMERGRWRVQKEICDFSKILQEEMEVANIKAAKKSITVGLEGDARSIPLFLGDEGRLKQLVGHLIYNSILASPFSSHISIFVANENNRLTFSLRDQGGSGRAGSIELSLERIDWEEGSNRMGEMSPSPQLSLGLIVCKKIVEAHKGEIWAESKGPGLGRIFSFSIPLELVVQPQALPSSHL